MCFSCVALRQKYGGGRLLHVLRQMETELYTFGDA